MLSGNGAAVGTGLGEALAAAETVGLGLGEALACAVGLPRPLRKTTVSSAATATVATEATPVSHPLGLRYQGIANLLDSIPVRTRAARSRGRGDWRMPASIWRCWLNASSVSRHS